MYLSGHQTLVYPSVIIILATQSLFCNCKALKLSCGSDNILEVMEETSNMSVTCSGLDITNTVEWNLNSRVIGNCTAPTNGEDTCTEKEMAPHLIPFREDVNESVMIINATYLREQILVKNISLKCQISELVSASCNVDLIFPPDGTCLAKFIRRDSLPWGISIECTITKVYSLLGRYQCDFVSAILNSETRVFSDKSPVLQSAAGKYKTFSCEFSGNMPTVEGIYNYKAIITPGRKIITATVMDRLEILKPSKSTVNCIPSPAVPENTNVTCTCNTTNIGKPGGRLSWYKGNNQIGTGEYGDNTLVMSQTLYRNDSDVTQFRCDVQWTTVVSGDSWKISVGYIAKPEMTINLSSNLSVVENETVKFDCQADGKPVPTLRLLNSNSNETLSVMTSPLSYSVSSVHCEVTATYICVASNSMGEDTQTSANLYVKCISTTISEAGDQINDAVGGGIAAGIVVITVIIVTGAVILKWRNKGKQDGYNVSVSLPTQTIAEDAYRTKP